MLALAATSLDPTDPLRGATICEMADPVPAEEWTTISLRAASVNHHDLLALRGTGLVAADLPRILGCDGAGLDQSGNEVVIYPGVNDPGWHGPDDMDPRLSLISERCHGTFAEKIAVPKSNVFPKPPAFSFEEAACLPTAWLTAYRMLFTQAAATPGSTALVQGAGGGVATALIMLGKSAGVQVWVTSRSQEKRARALELGAAGAFEPGARLPRRVDCVMDTVGAATWRHSLAAVRSGGTVVVAGTTTGDDPPAHLSRILLGKLRIVGSTIGTREEFARLLQFCSDCDIRPPVHMSVDLEQGTAGLKAMLAGEIFGKVVIRIRS
jgi:NADPH:quinone reductase-like Zn-dependent oxidoreductase